MDTTQNKDYWRKRMAALEDDQYHHSMDYYKDVQEQFRRASNNMQMDIERWYQRLADNNDISYAAAKRLLKKNELDEFHWSVEQYIKAGNENAIDKRWMKELENASARHHISYLEAMKLQIQQHAERLSTEFAGGMTDFLHKTYGDEYYKTAFEISRGSGVGVNLARLDNQKIDMVVKKPWARDGANFSDRIWTNKEKLVNNLHTELTQSIIRGEAPQKAIEGLAKTMNVSKAQAGRLIMTESAAISSSAAKDSYRELGVEQYEILATLDSHTSEICRDLDGKVFDMKDYAVGDTAPPFHPHCRTTTIPFFDDEFSAVEQRAAGDGETGDTVYVDGKMNYREWEKKLTKKGLSAGGKVSDGIPEHKKPIQLENVDFSNNNVVLSKLKEYENMIVDSPIENAIVISKDGTIRQCFGDLNGLYPDSDLGEELIGACVTHNHPAGSVNEYSFSVADINLFMENQLEQLRGIDEKYIYVLTRNPADIDEHMSIFDLEDEFDARHEKVIDIAKKYGLGYRRWTRE